MTTDRPSRLPKRIFLIGPRGSGKTSVAWLLAESLAWKWVDADEEVERLAGRSIREIFATEGEAGFRTREAEVLASLCEPTRQVIATGGGVVLRPDNRARLKSGGLVVWLQADAETLFRRTQEDASTAERRPVLTVGGPAEVEQILAQREALYRECAHQTVWTVGRELEEVVAKILAPLLQEDGAEGKV